MADAPLLVGIDFGTTTIKAIAFTPAGRAVATAASPTPTRYPQPGWATYDPEELWTATVAALRTLTGQLEDPAAIVGIAVASVGETGVLLDAAGRPISEAIAWFDSRTEPQVRWLEQQIGAAAIFASTGLSLQPIFSLCKILWLKQQQPELWARAVTWLNAAEYLAYRLCGEMATDYSMASRTLALNLAQLSWDGDLLQAAGVSPTLMAPLARSGLALGPILPAVAVATGLPAHTTVGVGGHDHVCGAFALGVTTEGDLLDSMGTAEGLFLPLDSPLIDPVVGQLGYSQGVHVSGGYYGLAGLYTSGICTDWFRANFAAETDYTTLIGEARRVAPGSIGAFFLPHLRLANPGYAAPHSRGAFIGLTTDADRAVLYRAVLEGVAYDARHSLTTLVAHSRLRTVDRIRVTGGGTRNRLLLEIKANVFDRTLEVVSIDEATALGAALLGGVAAGLFVDCAAAARAVTYDTVMIAPDPALVALYDRGYRTVFAQLAETLYALHDARFHFLHDHD